ncbi:MAG: 30S ribosomal protein S20, partial [Candidatus Rokuibacteriota bacterium]
MANIRSAIKRIRQNERRRVRNAAVRSTVRTGVKSVRAALESGAKD